MRSECKGSRDEAGVFFQSNSQGHRHNDVGHGGCVWMAVFLTAYSLVVLLIKRVGKLSNLLLKNSSGAFLGDVNCLFLLAGTQPIKTAKLTLKKGRGQSHKQSVFP